MVKVRNIDELGNMLHEGFCSEFVHMEYMIKQDILICKDMDGKITASPLVDETYTTLIPLKNIKELVENGSIYKKPYMF